MGQIFHCILLLLILSGTFGKYVYILNKKTWHEALEYCRQSYTDLAPISNEYDNNKLQQPSSEIETYAWIGMEKNSTGGKNWTWSGGGKVSTFFWASGQPDNQDGQDYGAIKDYLWSDFTPGAVIPFFCYSVIVVRKEKTWEEALEYCREHHKDLASVASETEMLLIQRELRKYVTTEHVWVGMHFFPVEWLWVDGQPLSYEAWGGEGKPVCPPSERHCVALQAMGGSQDVTTKPLLTAQLTKVEDEGEEDEDHDETERDRRNVEEEGKWEAYSCEKKLHFICY